MLKLSDVDLTIDATAAPFVKNEVVEVGFATTDGEVISREGINHFHAGDALITSSSGDRWSVSRNRFNAKYQPISPLAPGEDGQYRSKPVVVWARQMLEPFTVVRSANGDVLRGAVHDWLLQYAPGDYGIVENSRFQRVYCRRSN